MSIGKIIVISAPSGCGKSTIINRILEQNEINLAFSVSATNRLPREGELDGVHYHFLETEVFKEKVGKGEFIEWEEVYPGRFYGTLFSEVDRQIDAGRNLILDIDVKGAINVKRIYGERALTIFIEPPSLSELRRRLETRGTDSSETIEIRLNKAEYEISFADRFDICIVNDNLDKAVEETSTAIKTFIK